jgi:hypothetical protein
MPKAKALLILLGYPMKKSTIAPHYLPSRASEEFTPDLLTKSAVSFIIYTIRIRVQGT